MPFLEGSFSAAAGTRTYKLYLPAHPPTAKPPLLVMLHGCTQTPDDFARGTRMNALAEDYGFVVLYPAQPRRANLQRCWNWFHKGHQQRDQGEPAILADMTQQIVQQYELDSSRVFVAGLSAGAAMAAILAQVYPEIYSASGIHSGLPRGAAHGLLSALLAMKFGKRSPAATSIVPTIVFHGDKDRNVHPRNSDYLVDQMARDFKPVVVQGQLPGGHAYTCASYANRVEHWTVHGAGHAWSGGDAAGTYTDPLGPDASREMVRFFLAQAAFRRGANPSFHDAMQLGRSPAGPGV